MIELLKISKVYEKNNYALKNVSLSLPSKGLIAITGKSGSGKSTMLNLIGAIDSFEGSLRFQNQKIEDMSKTQLEYYRSSIVSFVFQEFYLIEHLSIGENLEIILNLQNKHNNIKERICEALIDVDLEGFADRKVSTLSGGEKQRVSLARAILSDSILILSDEPTGNLDEENSDIVLSLLKAISIDKLVIIVSHDVEFMSRYCDRMITLRDGTIVSDVDINAIKNINEKVISIEEKKGSSLSTINVLKMSAKNILIKKTRLITTVVLLTLSFFLLGIAMIYNTFDVNDVAINAFYSNSDRDVDFYRTSDNFIISTDDATITKLEEISNSFIFNRRIMNSYDLGTNPDPILIFTQKTAISMYDSTYFTKIGFTEELTSEIMLLGEIPSSTGEVAISDYMASMILKYDDTLDFSTMDELLNSELNDPSNSGEFKISGIYDTNYEDQYYQLSESQEYNVKYINRMYNDYQMIYMTQDTFDNMFNTIGYMELIDNGRVSNIRVAKPQSEFNGVLIGEIPVSSDQVVVSLSMLDKFISDSIVAGTLTGKTSEIMSFIGNTIILETSTDYYETFIVSGIIDDFNLNPSLTFMFTEDVFEEFDFNNKSLGKIEVYNVILTGNKILDSNLIEYFYDNNIRHDNSYSYQIYAVEDIQDRISPILFIMGIVFLLIGFLTLVNYIISTINLKQKEIGILLSIGVPTKNIKELFFIQIMVIISISFVLTTLLLILATHFQNESLASEWNLDIDVFLLRFKDIATLISLTFAVAIATFIIVLRRITRMSPVKAIRDFVL